MIKTMNHMFENSKRSSELIVIEKELTSFFDYCKSHGFSEQEMKQICTPLNNLIKTTILYKTIQKIIITGIVIILLYCLLQLEVIAWNLSAIGRIFLIKFLPYWNWQNLQNENCLIDNFVYSKPEQELFCTSCENIDEISVENNIDPYKLSEIYLDTNVPVIITDGLRNWPLQTNITHGILSDTILSNSLPCELSTNMFANNEFVDTVLIKSQNFPKWFFHFQNCDFVVVKQFRLLSPRPYFLKPEILPVQYNWLLMSYNYRFKKHKPISLREKITVIGQLTGSNLIKLIPRLNCADECSIIEFELRNGEACIFTSLWDLEYKPASLENNVAIILETH